MTQSSTPSLNLAPNADAVKDEQSSAALLPIYVASGVVGAIVLLAIAMWVSRRRHALGHPAVEPANPSTNMHVNPAWTPANYNPAMLRVHPAADQVDPSHARVASPRRPYVGVYTSTARGEPTAQPSQLLDRRLSLSSTAA